MMKLECSKRVRALVRQLAATAYERELSGIMDKLEKSFFRWHKGDIDTIKLAAEVDQFARGRQRRHLEQRYNATSILHMNVAQAIVRGILKSDEVPDDVLAALERAIEFYRNGLADGTISFEEED